MAQSPSNLISPEAMELGYQPENLRFRDFAFIVAGIAILLVVLHIFLWYVMKDYDARDARADLPRSIVPIQSWARPPGPDLQPSVGHDTLPYQDLEAMREHEDAIFAKLGWNVDAQTHAARMPSDIIDRVMQDERARASAPAVPPTTTGKNTNSIVPGAVPPYDTQPGAQGVPRQ